MAKIHPYSSVVVIALVVGTRGIEWAMASMLEVMAGIMESSPLVVHPCPSYFDGLALVVILGEGLEAELHQVHFPDSVIRPSNRPCLAWQVLNLTYYLAPLLLLLIWVFDLAFPVDHHYWDRWGFHVEAIILTLEPS